MAGTYVELTNPGYSTLFTRDVAFQPNTDLGEGASLNPFDPDSDAPLYEGEWLEYVAHSDGNQSAMQRGGGGAPASSAGSVIIEDGTNPEYASSPQFLYFMERGRYDAQVTKKVHVLTGPQGFEFRTKLCAVASSVSVGARVLVATLINTSGQTMRGITSMTATSGSYWSPGFITRVHGTNDISVMYDPSYVTVS
jgi:hypothetical protein